MQRGPSVRARRSEQQYIKYRKSLPSKEHCDFCAFTLQSSEVKKDVGLFWLTINKFGYTIWDGCLVTEHLMLIPKRHVHSLGELTKAEKANYVAIISDYEAAGYSLYSRAPQNITKSIPHQHTHLMKFEPRRIKFLIYLYHPHLLFFR